MVMMMVGRFLTNSAYSVFRKVEGVVIGGFLYFCMFFISAMLGGMSESMTVKVITNSFRLL